MVSSQTFVGGITVRRLLSDKGGKNGKKNSKTPTEDFRRRLARGGLMTERSNFLADGDAFFLGFAVDLSDVRAKLAVRALPAVRKRRAALEIAPPCEEGDSYERSKVQWFNVATSCDLGFVKPVVQLKKDVGRSRQGIERFKDGAARYVDVDVDVRRPVDGFCVRLHDRVARRC